MITAPDNVQIAKCFFVPVRHHWLEVIARKTDFQPSHARRGYRHKPVLIETTSFKLGKRMSAHNIPPNSITPATINCNIEVVADQQFVLGSDRRFTRISRVHFLFETNCDLRTTEPAVDLTDHATDQFAAPTLGIIIKRRRSSDFADLSIHGAQFCQGPGFEIRHLLHPACFDQTLFDKVDRARHLNHDTGQAIEPHFPLLDDLGVHKGLELGLAIRAVVHFLTPVPFAYLLNTV